MQNPITTRRVDQLLRRISQETVNHVVSELKREHWGLAPVQMMNEAKVKEILEDAFYDLANKICNEVR